MIETGTVTERRENGRILVDFPHLQTQAECPVLQPTTGENSIFVLPSVGTQVICWLESGKNIVLGAVYSGSEKTPDGADPDGQLHSFGKTSVEIKKDKAAIVNDKTALELTAESAMLRQDTTTLELSADKAIIKQDQAVIELSGGKATLKNDQTNLNTILKEILSTLKTISVSTAMGPSGPPLPPTFQAIIKCELLVDKLLK